VDGLKPNAEKCAELLEKSPISATALNPIIGYDRAREADQGSACEESERETARH